MSPFFVVARLEWKRCCREVCGAPILFLKRLQCLLTVVKRLVIQAGEVNAFDVAVFSSLSTASLRGIAVAEDKLERKAYSTFSQL
jgi:hypothetical protein